MEIIDEDKFGETLDKIYANFNKETTKYLKKTGTELLRKVKKETPVDTGTLKRSWDMELGEDEVVVATNVKYAEPVEFGHRTRGGNKVVEGKYMLKKGVEEIEKTLDIEFEIMIEKFWGR